MSALLSLTGRILWPSLATKFLWCILLTATLAASLTGQPKIAVVPLVCLMLLMFCIPLQFMPLSRNRSWLLLPYFRPHSRLLLLTLPLIFGLVCGMVMQMVDKGFWLPMQLGVFAMALLILPCFLFGHILPLLFNSALLVLFFASKLPLFLAELGQPVLISILLIVNTLLLVWFATRWLAPGRHSARHSTIVKFQHANYKLFLQRFTRKAASLHGSLLLGQGDSWRARGLRTLACCWYLPGMLWLSMQLFSNADIKEQSLLLVLFVVFPVFLLTEQLSNMLRRVRRAWLTLPISRQQLFQMLEQQALQETLLATLIISPLLVLIFPDVTTAAAMLLLWPSILLCSTYLSWRLINQSLVWTGLVMITLNIAVVSYLLLYWQQPLALLLLATITAGLSALLRQQVQRQLMGQDWGKLKLLKAPQIRTGL
ncbi:hypothetical protein [Arsukibacterium sp.]|uniref:hypothetical protein n=1 Tax=Arsukibacterium sp. TaxID=1977258 RepID=UPI002FD95061